MPLPVLTMEAGRGEHAWPLAQRRRCALSAPRYSVSRSVAPSSTSRVRNAASVRRERSLLRGARRRCDGLEVESVTVVDLSRRTEREQGPGPPQLGDEAGPARVAAASSSRLVYRSPDPCRPGQHDACTPSPAACARPSPWPSQPPPSPDPGSTGSMTWPEEFHRCRRRPSPHRAIPLAITRPSTTSDQAEVKPRTATTTSELAVLTTHGSPTADRRRSISHQRPPAPAPRRRRTSASSRSPYASAVSPGCTLGA